MEQTYFAVYKNAIYDAQCVCTRGEKHGNAYVYTCYLQVTKYAFDGQTIQPVGSERMREMRGNRFLQDKYWFISVLKALQKNEIFPARAIGRPGPAPDHRATRRLHIQTLHARFATRRLQMSTSATDRIEKTIVLRAPRSRVWRAIANAREFGQWFGVKLEGDFVEGGSIAGKITYPGYEHLTMEMLIERIEPERYFADRWHPYAIEPTVDYSPEPTTHVEFKLEDADGGVLLTIIESGFDQVPLARRALAFRMNDAGMGRTDPQHRAPCLERITPPNRN